jgi:NMT1-like family
MASESPANEAEPTRRRGFRLTLKVTAVSWLDLAQTLGPVLILSTVAILVALHYVRPAPPSSLTLSSGPVGSTFRTDAEQYKKILARNGIELKIVTSEGSLDNLKRLSDPNSGVDVALVQSGIPAISESSDVVSLGSVFYQPLTIFYRSRKPLHRLSELHEDRIAIGPEGSGTRFLALALLKANEIEPNGNTRLLELEGDPARTALLHRQVDAIFLTGDSASTTTIREMLHAEGIRLFDFSQAEAYVRRFPYLSNLELPPGAFDLGENLPPSTLHMLAPTVELLAHSSLHPALSDLLIEAAMEVHGHSSLLQKAGQFPTPLVHSFPISTEATRYYKTGKTFAYRYLPFWLASLLERALVVLVPICVVVIPGLRYLPQLYNWRIQSRIHRRYGELMALEREAQGHLSAQRRAQLLDRVDEIEKAVITVKMPGSHAEALYGLRQHIRFVRENLARSAVSSEASAASGPAHAAE